MSNLQSPVWNPPTNTNGLQVEQFRQHVNVTHGLTLDTYDDLHRFSISRRNDFWLTLWRYYHLKSDLPPIEAVDETVSIQALPEWFKGTRLNYAQNVLSSGTAGVAIKALNEANIRTGPKEVSWDVLRGLTFSVASALETLNVAKGDVVAYIGTNSVDAVVTQLAAATIGAVFTSVAADMGEKSVVDRLKQVRPVVLFAEDAYSYNGKHHVCLDKASRIVLALRRLAGLRSAVLVRNTAVQTSMRHHTSPHVDWIDYHDAVRNGQKNRKTFVQVPFHHPMLILFSSGTTGAPKGIIHSQGGTLLNLLKEHALHENMSSKDTYYHYSNIGWTMWNIFLGGLLSGATIVLYDGSPFYPSPVKNLEAIIRTGTTVFGASPRYYEELRLRNIVPARNMDCSQVRLLGSTGAVLPQSLWTWVVEAFDNCPMFSFSGGTEICGSFLHGVLTKPHYAGEITAAALGVDAASVGPDGLPCPGDTAGELVCRKAIPNTPIGLWNDVDGKRYHEAYFAQFEGFWTQGDLCRISRETGGITMLGRSDATLNPSGVRFGSADIYSVIDEYFAAEVRDSLCVGQQAPGEHERVFLFLQMHPGSSLTEHLISRIKARIAEALSRRHIPHHMCAVGQIPYNANGKKLEIPVKRIISGTDFARNPGDGLEDFKRFAPVKHKNTSRL